MDYNNQTPKWDNDEHGIVFALGSLDEDLVSVCPEEAFQLLLAAIQK